MSKFDWKQIAGPLIKAGMGTLGGALGGPAGAAIGGAIGPVIAEALGVEAEPEKVAQAIERDPAGAGEAIRNREAEIEALRARAETDFITAVNETYRQELKHESWFVRGWRPACGWMLCLIWGLHGFGIGKAIWFKDFETIKMIADLTVFYAVMGAVTGVYAWRRTDEKKAGVSDGGAVIGGVIGAAIRKAGRK